MNLKYLRVPQDASDLLHTENEKDGIGDQPHLLSWKNLILLFSVVVNAVLCLSLATTMREKPTPTGFGEHNDAISVRVPTD